jgi:poly-gamma-glutamate synthesis protein (capsule biosynthesis protein)
MKSAVAILVCAVLLVPAFIMHDVAAVGSPKESVTEVLFVGDLIFDRTIRTYADMYGDDHPFSCVEDELRAYDMVVANLEGPITDNPSVSAIPPYSGPNNTRFTMPIRTAAVLARYGIHAVSLGNNHIYDFGGEGIDATRQALTASGIVFAGDPRDASNTAVRIETVPVPFTMVVFNEFFGSAEDTIAAIRSVEEHETVIVFAHWGEEYVPVTERQKVWARQFIDAGADMVIGAHPHVIQESEVYNGAAIYYSLGNFLFDQYGSEDVRKGLALGLTISPRGIETIEERFTLHSSDRRTCFLPVE